MGVLRGWGGGRSSGTDVLGKSIIAKGREKYVYCMVDTFRLLLLPLLVEQLSKILYDQTPIMWDEARWIVGGAGL